MKCLVEKLEELNGDAILWISTNSVPINSAQIRSAIFGRSSAEWFGKRVAIGDLTVVEFLTTLIFLDGLVDAILLLPSEEDAKVREARLAEAKIEVIIEKGGLGFVEAYANPPLSLKFERPAPMETAWLLPTSGTTGKPKLINHTFATLTRSMRNRNVGSSFIWGSLYSLRRFAGLQVFLQSWVSSTQLALVEEGMDLSATLKCLIECGCNAISATPSMWRKMAMLPLFSELKLKQITLGGELIDQAVLDMLATRFPGARITHIYASTEAGVGFAVHDVKAGFPIKYLMQSPSDLEFFINENNHLVFNVGKHKGLASEISSDLIDSGDVVKINGDRVFFLGRANGSINVGGNKVMPEEIEAVIKEIPDVAFVQVRSRKSTVLGNLVEAAIIPKDNILFDQFFKKKIIDYCRERMESYKVPAFIVPLESINLTSSGKLSRVNEK